MFAPDSFAVVKVRERHGADLFVILIADLRNADRTGHSWSCSREMSAEELARALEIEGLSPEAIGARRARPGSLPGGAGRIAYCLAAATIFRSMTFLAASIAGSSVSRRVEVPFSFRNCWMNESS